MLHDMPCARLQCRADVRHVPILFHVLGRLTAAASPMCLPLRSCGYVFCSGHRHAQDHNCSFDYAAFDKVGFFPAACCQWLAGSALVRVLPLQPRPSACKGRSRPPHCHSCCRAPSLLTAFASLSPLLQTNLAKANQKVVAAKVDKL